MELFRGSLIISLLELLSAYHIQPGGAHIAADNFESRQACPVSSE